MPQLLRLILVIAVIAAVGIGIYYWMSDQQRVEEVELNGAVDKPEQP